MRPDRVGAAGLPQAPRPLPGALREKAVWRRLAGWQWERIALAVSVVSIRTLLR